MDRYSRLIVKWKILQPPKADMALLVDPVQWMRHHRFESYDWLPPRKSSYLVQKLLSIDPVIPWTTIAFCDNMRRGQLVLNLSPMDPLLAYIETAPDPFQLSSRIKRYNNNLFGLSIDRHKRTPMQLYVEGDYRQERESARRQRNADFFDIQKKISAVEARVGYENRRQSRIWQRLMAKSREITA